MKILIMLILVAVSQTACGHGVVQFRTEAQALNSNSSSSSYDVECSVENYKPRSRAELLAMSPRELIDERIRSDPNSFDSYSAMADYENLIEELIRKAGLKALPVISEYIDSYDHKNRSECTESRFATVSSLISDIDRFDFRLRGTKEGRETIASLENALQQIVTAEPGLNFTNGSKSRHQPAAFMFLRQFKGINLADRNVADTLWVRYKVKLSDDELLEFTNYLISQDPKYPGWSTDEFIKDYSRINEAGNPAQVYVYNDAKRFYDAYLDFKGSRKN